MQEVKTLRKLILASFIDYRNEGRFTFKKLVCSAVDKLFDSKLAY